VRTVAFGRLRCSNPDSWAAALIGPRLGWALTRQSAYASLRSVSDSCLYMFDGCRPVEAHYPNRAAGPSCPPRYSRFCSSMAR
jgi:hypothetical protein